MKTKWLLFSLTFFFSVLCARAEKVLKLKGIVTAMGKTGAVVEVSDADSHFSEEYLLGEGRNWDGVNWSGIKLLKIDAENGIVTLKQGEQTQSLIWNQNGDLGSTNKVASIRLRSVSLPSAMILYAFYKGRTVMQHPQLGSRTFSLNASADSKEEAAAILEKMFRAQDIATIPDGEHFVLAVPFSITNAIEPRAASLTTTNQLLPELSINFRNAPMGLALQAYADYVHRKLILPQTGICCDTLTFTQFTPLSKEEIIYALETLFQWNNIRLTPEGGENLKVEQRPRAPVSELRLIRTMLVRFRG